MLGSTYNMYLVPIFISPPSGRQVNGLTEYKFSNSGSRLAQTRLSSACFYFYYYYYSRVDLGAGEVARPAHSSSLEEEEDGPRATTRLPAGRMRAALESMREFSRHMTAATWRTKRLLRLVEGLNVLVAELGSPAAVGSEGGDGEDEKREEDAGCGGDLVILEVLGGLGGVGAAGVAGCILSSRSRFAQACRCRQWPMAGRSSLAAAAGGWRLSACGMCGIWHLIDLGSQARGRTALEGGPR
eukprot:scaffold806_cov115-Isochrysis_galbana.AAC.4